MLNIRQECGHHAEQRQVRADSIDKLDTVLVGETSQYRGADSTDAECETEKQSRVAPQSAE